ncbi:MAG: DMT family transporter [Alphaproteobacteria bacterium]|nr:DMT family transporter [Alphaproteobacteria bacterium]
MTPPGDAIRISAATGLPVPIRAALWYVGALSLWGASAGMVRYATLELPAIELGFLRALFGAVLMVPWLIRGRIFPLPRRHIGIYLLRGVVEVLAIATWFLSLAVLQAADVVALGFTMPLFATLLAAIFLGERLRLRRAAAIVVGLLGALLVMKPGGSAAGWWAAVPVLGAVAVAGSRITGRVLARHGEPMVTVIASLGFITAPLLLVPALFVWEWPSLSVLLLALAITVVSMIGHVLMIWALRLGEASSLVPYEFTQLLATVAFGVIMMGEWPDRWTWIGSAVILCAGIYIVRREAALARQAALKPTPRP